MTVSMVRRCHETETRPITFDEIWEATRNGSHGLKGKITQIRNRFDMEWELTQDKKKAKEAVAGLKLELPGFMPSGNFTERNNAAIVEHSGVLCADLDSLGHALPQVRQFFQECPHVRAVALSPSGDGLKVFFAVQPNVERHGDSFRAIKDYCLDRIGFEIDEKCKDPARICFFTYDPELWLRSDATVIEPAAPLPRAERPVQSANATSREQIAFGLLGELKFDSIKNGYFVRCPGETFHSAKTGDKHTILYLDTVPTLACQHESCKHAVEAFNRVIRSEIGKAEKPIVAHRTSYRGMRNATNPDKLNGDSDLTPKKPHIEIYSPIQLKNYEPPPDIQLIGDCHIVGDKSHTAVIGGPGGVGKSLALNWLAIAGATGEGEWFGLPVHRKFKTFIIQNENSAYRLSQNFKALDCDMLNDYVRITAPPEYGMLLHHDEFRKELAEKILEFIGDESSVVAFDPFNSGAPDQEQRTYLETFSILKSLLPPKAGLVIAHHLRKPQSAELSKGRSLMFMLAGSYVLTSVPRSVFVMQPASDDVEDDQVVWTCSKNNNGELGKRSAWTRQNGVFANVANFDWDTFDSDSKDKRVVITDEMVQEVFKDGPVILTEARDKLFELSGASKSQCYRVLSQKGKYADHLVFKGNLLDWIR